MLVYRRTQESDRETITQWIQRDSNHSFQSDAGGWLPQNGADCYLVSDGDGEPLFFARMTKSMRIDIQFCSENNRKMPRAIDEFTKDMKKSAKGAGFRELIFDSVFHPLVRFLRKRGFRCSESEQICPL